MKISNQPMYSCKRIGTFVLDVKNQPISMHESYAITNRSNVPIYAMYPDGSVSELLPSGKVNRPWESEIIQIDTIRRIGTHALSNDVLPNDHIQLDTTGKIIRYPGYRIEIRLDVLKDKPVYVKEVGISLSIDRNIDKLNAVHPLGVMYRQEALIKAHKDFINHYGCIPISVDANSYDLSIDKYYVVINGNITVVKMHHVLPAVPLLNASEIGSSDNALKSGKSVKPIKQTDDTSNDSTDDIKTQELVLIHINSLTGNTDDFQIKVPTAACEEVTKNGFTFIHGYNLEMIRKKLLEKEVMQKQCLSPDEIAKKIDLALFDNINKLNAVTKERDQLKTAIASLQRELLLAKKNANLNDTDVNIRIDIAVKNLRDENDRLKQQNKLLMVDLKNLTDELNKANDPLRLSAEQLAAKQKIEALKLQIKNMEQRHQAEMERERYEHEFKMHEAQEKYKHDRIIEEIKRSKENTSYRSSKVSTIGIIAKTIAAIIPLLVTFGYWVVNKTTVSSIVSSIVMGACKWTIIKSEAFTISTIAKTAAAAIPLLAAFGYWAVNKTMVGGVVGNIVTGVCKWASIKAVRYHPIVKAASTIANAVTNVGGGVVNTVTKVVKTISSAVANVVKKVGSMIA